MYQNKEEVSSMFLTAIRKEKEDIFEQGNIKGLKEAIELGLELKFGEKGLKLMPVVNKINEITKLDEIKEAIRKEKTLTAIKKLL